MVLLKSMHTDKEWCICMARISNTDKKAMLHGANPEQQLIIFKNCSTKRIQSVTIQIMSCRGNRIVIVLVRHGKL